MKINSLRFNGVPVSEAALILYCYLWLHRLTHRAQL